MPCMYFDMLFANVLLVSNMEHFVRLCIQITLSFQSEWNEIIMAKLVYNGLNWNHLVYYYLVYCYIEYFLLSPWIQLKLLARAPIQTTSNQETYTKQNPTTQLGQSEMEICAVWESIGQKPFEKICTSNQPEMEPKYKPNHKNITTNDNPKF